MKKLILLSIVFLILSIGLQAQIGISAGWVQYEAPEFDDVIENNQFLIDNSPVFDQTGIQIGVDYWFRLKKKRVEFLPELSFYQLSANLESISTNPDIVPFDAELRANLFQLHFNTQIYPFDFEGDCDCPTFSKDGDLFKKGLFIRLAPGLAYGIFKDTRTNSSAGIATEIETNESSIAPSFRAGVGLDIGISDFFTVTPIIQYTYTMDSGGFNSLPQEESTDPALSEITQLYFGLRLGFRFDELNKYGYR